MTARMSTKNTTTKPLARDAVCDDLTASHTVAAALGMSNLALTQWRYRGGGPPFIRVGRRIRYRWTDVQAWLDENTERPA